MAKKMITYTCQILVGHTSSPRGGLAPGSIRQLLLTEDDRPAWRLFDFSIEGPRRPLAIWIPQSSETILDDGILMIAFHIARDRTCREILKPYLEDGGYGVDASADFPDGVVENAREACRQSSFSGDRCTKLIIVPFYNSSIMDQLADVQNYRFEYELLEPKLRRGRLRAPPPGERSPLHVPHGGIKQTVHGHGSWPRRWPRARSSAQLRSFALAHGPTCGPHLLSRSGPDFRALSSPGHSFTDHKTGCPQPRCDSTSDSIG